MRVFSLRGAHLAVMFARAERAPHSPERALEIARRIQYHQITLHRRHSASGLSTFTPEQKDLFAAVQLPEPSAKAL